MVTALVCICILPYQDSGYLEADSKTEAYCDLPYQESGYLGADSKTEAYCNKFIGGSSQGQHL